MKKLGVFILSFTFVGCALGPKERILRNASMGFVAGAVYGYSKPEYQSQNSLMYGGLTAAAVAIASVYLEPAFDENEKLKTETQKLKDELDQAFSPKIEKQLPGTLGGKVPEKYRNLINPGEWKVFALDQWIDDGENRMIHQDKMMELIPPSLTPRQLPVTKSKKGNP